jgi:hypothetical protein
MTDVYSKMGLIQFGQRLERPGDNQNDKFLINICTANAFGWVRRLPL